MLPGGHTQGTEPESQEKKKKKGLLPRHLPDVRPGCGLIFEPKAGNATTDNTFGGTSGGSRVLGCALRTEQYMGNPPSKLAPRSNKDYAKMSATAVGKAPKPAQSVRTTASSAKKELNRRRGTSLG